MIKRNLIPILAIAFVGLVTLFVFSSQKGTVVASISDKSEIKDNVAISFSADKYKKSYLVPGSIKLRPGSYSFSAYAPGSSILEGKVTVANGQDAAITILLTKNPDADLPGSNPDSLDDIPNYGLFPHVTGDYRLEAVLNSDSTKIDHLRLTVYHHFATSFNEQDRQAALADAKKWLADNNISDTFKITVVDE
ncbi:MAG: hypothetical protein WD970_02455 [Patescibacteria group bacterium]